ALWLSGPVAVRYRGPVSHVVLPLFRHTASCCIAHVKRNGYRRTATTISVRTDVIESAGLSGADVASWSDSAPPADQRFDGAAQSASAFLRHGVELLGRLPEPRDRSEPERDAATAIKDGLTRAREEFLEHHATELYERLTNNYATSMRLEQLVYDVATEVPGL